MTRTFNLVLVVLLAIAGRGKCWRIQLFIFSYSFSISRDPLIISDLVNLFYLLFSIFFFFQNHFSAATLKIVWLFHHEHLRNFTVMGISSSIQVLQAHIFLLIQLHIQQLTARQPQPQQQPQL